MSLTAIEVKRLTCPEDRKKIKKSDGNGLFIVVMSNGSKLWRLRYRFSGKYQELALGQYPIISLADARTSANEARALLVQGINPTAERRARKYNSSDSTRNFTTIALPWWDQQESSWSDDHAKKAKRIVYKMLDSKLDIYDCIGLSTGKLLSSEERRRLTDKLWPIQ